MMKLKDLIDGLAVQKSIDFKDVPVEGIACDSRRVSPGYVFTCIRGLNEDGHGFIGDALSRGAAAVICEHQVITEKKIPQIVVGDTRLGLSHISSVFFGHPSLEMHVAGVTGTDGKTSTCYLCEAVIKETKKLCGVIGTISYRWGDRILPASKTTPGAIDTQKILREMQRGGCQYVFMEVSSHALAQQRVSDVEFRTGIFTNISLEHLDYHGTFEEYLKVKRKLFESLDKSAVAIVNYDDPESPCIVESTQARLITYGIERKADVTAGNISLRRDGISFTAEIYGKRTDIELKLIGKGNVYNALAAISFGVSENVDVEEIKKALGKAERIKGRLEAVSWQGEFDVFIDYAHTPRALEMLLRFFRKIAHGRLITVFGCGGDRDRSKRSVMGKISAVESDFTFITSDNPRNEDPAQIASEIESGFNELGKSSYKIIIDRKEAIREAITGARKGDIVVIAGKGHENYQVFRDTVVPFDDYEAASEVLGQMDRLVLCNINSCHSERSEESP